jgi:hypothetical protein
MDFFNRREQLSHKFVASEKLYITISSANHSTRHQNLPKKRQEKSSSFDPSGIHVKLNTAHPAPPSSLLNLLPRRNKSKSLIKIQSIWEVSKQRFK